MLISYKIELGVKLPHCFLLQKYLKTDRVVNCALVKFFGIFTKIDLISGGNWNLLCKTNNVEC